MVKEGEFKTYAPRHLWGCGSESEQRVTPVGKGSMECERPPLTVADKPQHWHDAQMTHMRLLGDRLGKGGDPCWQIIADLQLGEGSFDSL